MSQRDQRELRTTTDRSGTILQGNVSQLLVAANTNRAYLFIQNPSNASESLFINENAPAATIGCWELLPGSYLEFKAHGIVLVGQFNVMSVSIGHAFVCKEA